MSGDDLLKMLDLDGNHAAGSEPLTITSAEGGAGTGAKPAAPPSATALVLDQWAVRKGHDLRRDIPRLKALKLGRDADLAVADFHAACFEPEPALAETCKDARRGEFMEAMLQTPEYRELHVSTQLADLPAQLATVHFAEQFHKLLAEDKERDEQTPPAAPGTKEARRQEMKKHLACLRAAGDAVVQAQEEVKEADECTRAFGRGPGQPGAADTQAIASIFQRVRGSASMKLICAWCGRFRRVALSQQKNKVRHGYDDMVGVVTGGDLGRLLPNELATLADDELELDALQRIAEREALLWEYRGEEPEAKGPLVILTDESSSMRDVHNLEKSKALALTLAGIARQQKRWCALVGWADKGSYNPLVLPPAAWDERKLFDWLGHFYRGGTEPPLEAMDDIYRRTQAPVGKTDVVLITDGCFSCSAEEIAAFAQWKKQARARLVALIIGAGTDGDVTAIADEVHCIDGLDATSEGVAAVLSI